jgi:NAD+ synthase
LLRTDSNLSEAKRSIISFIRENVEESETDGLLLELDGSVNSAVTAHVCVEALGTRRVTAFIMPDLRVAGSDDLEDARTVAGEICLDTRYFDIAPIHKTFMKNLEGNRPAEENLDARIRTSFLCYQADLLNGLVVSSIDRSEYLLGNIGKHGDNSADILPIADMYKDQVRKLGEVLGINRRIVAKRSKKLTIRQAERMFNLDYDVVDEIFKLRLDLGVDTQGVAMRLGVSSAEVEAVFSHYESSSHNRLLPKLCSLP